MLLAAALALVVAAPSSVAGVSTPAVPAATPVVVHEGDVRAPSARRTPAELRFLRARALLQAGDPAGAAREASGLAPNLPAISDRVEALLAAAAEASGDVDGAIGALGRIPRDSLLWASSRVSMARLLLAAGKGGAAVEAIRPVIEAGGPEDPARGPAAARALLLGGDLFATQPGGGAEARRLFAACWSRHPLAPEAKDCRTRLEALPAPNGGPPSDEECVRRSETLLDLHRNDQALSEARKLGERLPPPGEASQVSCRAAFVRGKALRKLRQYQASVDELAPVVERCPDPQMRPKALYLLSVVRANVANADGIEAYRRFVQDYPDNQLSDDALYFAADLLVREGRVDEARALLDTLVERYPDGDFRADAIFRGAWLAWRKGELDVAVNGLARLEGLYKDDPYEHARAMYWRARVLAARKGKGDKDRAQAAWTEVVRLYPGDYYALLATARLAEAGRKVPVVKPAGEPRGAFRYQAGPLAADPHFRAALQLLRLDMDREATEELNAVDRKALASAPGHPEPLLLLAELFDRAGDARASHRLLRSQGRQILREPPEGMGLRVWQMAYPPAWRDQVVQYASPAGVPPDLLQALMREESALDPTVISGAGAVGLTQLMVPTAGLTARRLKLPAPTAHDLTDPRLNIRLGASYLGELLKRFGGSAPLALAAYNAGEAKVRNWWSLRGTLPLDEFVEEIPIQETRGYVKRVLRSYAAYRMLYGRENERPVRLLQALPPPP